MRRPEVCILPVAGLSTRNLPATKALHKGFLTLHSKPIIQYAVDACAEIGIKEIVFIYSDQSCKHLFEKHFAPYPWLENHLREKNKLDILDELLKIIPEGMKFSFASVHYTHRDENDSHCNDIQCRSRPSRFPVHWSSIHAACLMNWKDIQETGYTPALNAVRHCCVWEKY